MKNHFIVKLRNSFLAGVAVALPAVVTILFFNFLVRIVNRILCEPAIKFLRPFLPNIYSVFLAKFLTFLVVIIGITLIGFATKVLFLRRAFSWWERLFYKLPLVNKIYRGVKQISHVFLDEKRQVFNRVVLIEYPRKGIYSIGFTTGSSGEEIQGKTQADMLNVFVPTTPNPTSGMLIVVSEKDLIKLDMSVEDGLKLVISAGSVIPEDRVPHTKNTD